MPPAMRSAPSTATTAASAGVRRVRRDRGSSAPSCRAATGGTLVARSAGATAESMVTTTPTTSAMTTVRGCRTSPLWGMSKPPDLNT